MGRAELVSSRNNLDATRGPLGECSKVPGEPNRVDEVRLAPASRHGQGSVA